MNQLKHIFGNQHPWRQMVFVSITPLLLAGNTVVVSIHLHTGAISEEKSRLSAGFHLRAVCSAVAPELASGCRFALRCSWGFCFQNIGNAFKDNIGDAA